MRERPREASSHTISTGRQVGVSVGNRKPPEHVSSYSLRREHFKLLCLLIFSGSPELGDVEKLKANKLPFLTLAGLSSVSSPLCHRHKLTHSHTPTPTHTPTQTSAKGQRVSPALCAGIIYTVKNILLSRTNLEWNNTLTLTIASSSFNFSFIRLGQLFVSA